MGKDSRIKAHRRAYRTGATLPTPLLSPRTLRRTEMVVKTGSFSVMEIAQAFIQFHGVSSANSQDALNWAAAHHQSGVDWRMLRRVQPEAPGAAPAS